MNLLRRCSLAGVAAVCLWSGGGAAAGGETFSYDDVLNPKTVSRIECEAEPDRVWVETRWQQFGMFGRRFEQTAQGCIRYFPSGRAKRAATALLFLHGDVYSGSDVSQQRMNYQKAASNGSQVALSERASGMIGLPVIRIGRPGAYGSTGMSHVKERRMPIEAHLINAAIDAIKTRFGYRRLLLAGQSGGGGLAGAALTLGRTDLDCVVIASGAVSVKTRARLLDPQRWQKGFDQTGQLLAEVYDPIDHIDGVKKDHNRRIFILADPRDKKVGFASQKEFHEKLVAAGIPATLLIAEAADGMHHELVMQAQQVAGWCKTGFSDAEIQSRLNSRVP